MSRPQPSGYAVSRWADDPWSGGSWSLIGRYGSPADRVALGTPVGNRLRVAGEATHPTRAGMTHGAYEQGVDAARWAAGAGHRRVVVVGAGMAGLAAARELTALGVPNHVREARDRVGGRTAEARVGGLAFDLGANWLQQYDENALARIAEGLGLTTVETVFADPDEPEGLAAELRARLAAAPADATIADVLEAWKRDPGPWTAELLQRYADAEITMDSGLPLSRLSARHGFEPGVGEGDRWIVGGYRLLVDHLAAGLDVRLGRPVSRIRVTAGAVEVDEERADAVILTAPVPVLKRLDVEPPLPEALQRLDAGRVEKAVLRFDRPFWPSGGYFRLAGPAPGCMSEWLDASGAYDVPVLVGLFAGPWLDRLWAGTDAEVAQRVTDFVSRSLR